MLLARYKTEFSLFIYPLWILYLRVMFAGPTSDNYEYGIVSAGQPTNVGTDGPEGSFSGCITGNERVLNGAGLWLFTKEPTPDQNVVELLLNKTSELGFDLGILQPVEHVGCTYPSI